MASRDWKMQFRDWCTEERANHLKWADMLERGVFHLHENNVDISVEWANRNRRIAQEMGELIEKIDEDLQSESKT